MSNLKIISLLCFFSLSSTLFAQFELIETNGQCGTDGKPERLTAYQSGFFDGWLNESDDTLKLGITIHVVGTNSGAGYIKTTKLLKAFDVLQKDFLAFNILPFIEGEIRYINNSVFYDHNYTQGSTMMAFNNLPNTVNCYIVEDPAGNCGYYSPSRDGLVVAKNCLDPGDRTWSHELGHFLTLPHTFVGWDSSPETLPINEPAPNTVNGRQVEKADGSNCDVAADGFCDTPPDYMSFTWNCNSFGLYPESLLDPDSVQFDAIAGNIMSYVRDACLPAPGDGFSAEQMAAMEIDLMQRGNLIEEIECPGEVTNDNLSLISPADGEIINPVDEISVLLEWSSAENASHYLVEVSTNAFFSGLLGELIVSDTMLLLTTDIMPIQENRRYFWRVLPFNSVDMVTDYSEEFDFRIEDLLSTTSTAEFDQNIKVFPNPVSSTANTLSVSLQGVMANEVAVLKLSNSLGQTVSESKANTSGEGRLYYTFNTDELSTGLFFLTISLGGQETTRKVIIR